MNDLADTLAARCILTKEAMTDADVGQDPEMRRLRNLFDQSVSREQVLRRHAQRMHGMAESAGQSEPNEPGDIAGESLSRLLPIPRSLPEAAIRMPIVGATALAGRQLMRTNTDEQVKKLFQGKTKLTGKGGFRWDRPDMPAKKHNLPIRGLVGGLAGAAVGSIATGIPMAIMHAIKKLRGGESAWEARGGAEDAQRQAEAEQAKREELLAQIKARVPKPAAQAPVSKAAESDKQAEALTDRIKRLVEEHRHA
jgi:hypothetical protein